MQGNVVVLSRAGQRSIPPSVSARIKEHADLRFIRRDQAPDAEEAAALLSSATVLATTNVTLPRLDVALLERCADLRSVVLYASGYEHVDLRALSGHGVSLSVLPDYATVAVAEHALASMLALGTRLHLANDRARGVAAQGVSLRGMELRGRTLGILGLGRIGSQLARLAAGIGMNVIGSDIDPPARARAQAAGVRVVTTDALIDEAQVVAMCASTDPRAPTILTQRRVERMRRGSLVVNVGRPALVDNAAVARALREGHLRGYAVDDIVYDPVRDADLVMQGRVLQTAHSAWWRDEVLVRGAADFGAAILAAVLGAPIDTVTAPRGSITGSPSRVLVSEAGA